jgi:hypothetical protein
MENPQMKSIYFSPLPLALVLLSACGDASAPSYSKGAATSYSATLPASSLSVFPQEVFTGFDENGSYSVPVALDGASGKVTWSSSSNTADVSATTAGATIDGAKAGSAVVTVKDSGGSATVKVNVASYTAAQRSTGEAELKKIGCNGCHDSGADITPSGIGKHSHDQVVAAFTMGKNPEGGLVDDGNTPHSFDVSDPDALVAYLRSLAPRTNQPKADQ